jgi:hypothetical protein
MTGFAVTGSKRENLEDYALGEFMKHVRAGRIQPGSMLIVESADRLSRESAVIALNLFTELLMLGVVVVTLSPEMEYRTDADIGKLITAGVTIGRAHDESQIKHRRNAWVSKRATAKDQVLTSNVPRLVPASRGEASRHAAGWWRDQSRCREGGHGPADVQARTDGRGCKGSPKELNGDRTPVVGRGKKWTESSVYNILTSPAVVGEYHPHVGVQGSKKKGRAHTRKSTGEVIRGYYPWSLTVSSSSSCGTS